MHDEMCTDSARACAHESMNSAVAQRTGLQTSHQKTPHLLEMVGPTHQVTHATHRHGRAWSRSGTDGELFQLWHRMTYDRGTRGAREEGADELRDSAQAEVGLNVSLSLSLSVCAGREWSGV